MCTYDNLSPCIHSLKLNESSSACKCLSSSARIMRMMGACGRQLHGRLAALSGESVLLRDLTSACSSEAAEAKRHSWHLCETRVRQTNVAHYCKHC